MREFQVGEVVEFPSYYNWYDLVVQAGAIGRVREVTAEQIVVELGPCRTQLPMSFSAAARSLRLYARPTQADRLEELPEWARLEILDLRLKNIQARATQPSTRVSEERWVLLNEMLHWRLDGCVLRIRNQQSFIELLELLTPTGWQELAAFSNEEECQRYAAFLYLGDENA